MQISRTPKQTTIIALCTALLLTSAPPTHAEEQTPPVDSQYIQKHYPAVYQEIYQTGVKAGQQENSPDTPNATAKQPPAKPTLGAWWEKNSLTYAPLPQQWLFHIEGTLDTKFKYGNIESELYDGSASLMIRKRRWTNTLTYIIDKEYTEQETQPGAPPERTESDYRSFQESLRFDLTPRLYTEGGYLYEKDTANYIKGRDSYYAGLGYTLIDTPAHHLDAFLAGGYVEEEYPELIRLAMDMKSDSVSASYLRQSYQWRITEQITYKENFRIIHDLTDTKVFNDDVATLHQTGKTRRYRWFWINELYFKIVNHLSFMIGCKIDYDSNPWPTMEEQDVTVKSGIQFSF